MFSTVRVCRSSAVSASVRLSSLWRLRGSEDGARIGGQTLRWTTRSRGAAETHSSALSRSNSCTRGRLSSWPVESPRLELEAARASSCWRAQGQAAGQPVISSAQRGGAVGRTSCACKLSCSFASLPSAASSISLSALSRSRSMDRKAPSTSFGSGGRGGVTDLAGEDDDGTLGRYWASASAKRGSAQRARAAGLQEKASAPAPRQPSAPAGQPGPASGFCRSGAHSRA